MLAARWKHRNSKDLDVRVNDTEGCRAISRMADEPMLETALDRQMQAAGAWTKQRAGRLQLVYVFGDERDADPPRIDLAELPQLLDTKGRGSSGHDAEQSPKAPNADDTRGSARRPNGPANSVGSRTRTSRTSERRQSGKEGANGGAKVAR